MSHSLLYHAFGLRKGYHYRRTLYEKGCIIFQVEPEDELFECPDCHSHDIARKGGRSRDLQTVPIGLKPVFFRTSIPNCTCGQCGRRFEITPPFAQPYVSYTHRLQAFVGDLRAVMTISDLAGVTGLSWDTVKNIVKERLGHQYGRPPLRSLKYLSLDEIYVGRRRKFYTLVIDLETGRIVYVAPGRGGECLRKFWRSLRLSKAKIQAVAMDMSAAYWAAVAENLPKAAIVFDRFHIVKMVNEKLDDLRRELVREAVGLMKQKVKGIRHLLLMRRDHVGEEKLPRLDDALQHNEPLWIGYLLKEALGLLWDQPSRERMQAYLKEWCQWAMDSGVRQVQQAAKSLMFHARGILNWWDHRINNGRMEGINNKIKTLLRQTYGLRDELFFKLKLYSLHDSRQELLG